MAVTSVDLISENLDESIEGGFIQYRLTRVYQVITDSASDGPSVAMGGSGIPAAGATAILAGFGNTVWCVSRDAKRADAGDTRKKWHVTVVYSNNTNNFARNSTGTPIQTPTDMTKTVDVTWLEYPSPIDDARLKSITLGGPEWAPGVQSITIPAHMAGWQATPGPIRNSATIPRQVERVKYRKVITVSNVVDSWNNAWDDFTNCINSDSITITETDSNGTPFNQTYAPFTLRMKPPRKENLWQDSRLYYRRSFSMEYNRNTWIHSELDAGTTEYFFLGQYKSKDGTDESYTSQELQDLDASPVAVVEMTSQDENGTRTTLAQPVRMNAHGRRIPFDRGSSYDTDKAFFLNYEVNEIKAFGPLNL